MMQLLPLLCLAGVPWPQGSPSQLHYLDNELSMFMHYSICTYNEGCDGGQQNCAFEGKKQPWPASTFDPSGLDTDQWAETARDLGAKQVCLTVHHTGACGPLLSGAARCSLLRLLNRLHTVSRRSQRRWLCALANEYHCVRSQGISLLCQDGSRHRVRVCGERSQARHRALLLQ